MPQALRSAGSGSIETFGFYLKCLYDVAIHLGFATAYVQLHVAYHQYVLDPLPMGSAKVAGLVLALLDMFLLRRVVQRNLKGY